MRFVPSSFFKTGVRYAALCLIGVLLFRAADIPVEQNKDIDNYRLDYERSLNGYEAGYELIVQVMHQRLEVPFETFWMLVLIAQIFLLLLAYNLYGPTGGVWAYPILLSIAGSTIGMQVRFGLACALLILALVIFPRHRLLAMVVAVAAGFIHNATVLFSILYGIVLIQSYIQREWKVHWSIPITVLSVAVAVTALNIELLLKNGRYESYFGTDYFEAKSAGSIVYTVVMLVCLGVHARSKHIRSQPEFLLHFILLISVIILHQYAVIGGRLLVMSFFLEPLTIMRVLLPDSMQASRTICRAPAMPTQSDRPPTSSSETARAPSRRSVETSSATLLPWRVPKRLLLAGPLIVLSWSKVLVLAN
jgi:hypothetical protein